MMETAFHSPYGQLGHTATARGSANLADPAITDDMLDRHAARGVIRADQFRRGASEHATEAKAISGIIAESAAMARTDGITDKGLVGFLAMVACGHFYLRLDGAGGAS